MRRLALLRVCPTVAMSGLAVFLGAQPEAPVFEVQGPRREVPEGSRFEISFVLKNETAQRFIPPDFGGLSIRTGPMELRSAGFVGGKAYSQQSWVYEVEAERAGTYTIGPAVAQTSRRNFRSEPLTVRVVRSSVRRAPRSHSSAPEPYFALAEVIPDKAWLGQQMLYRLRLYTRVGVSEADLLELPDFEGFYAQERQRFDTRVRYEKVNGQQYAVRTLYEASLFAQRTGHGSVGPARLRLIVEERGRGLLGGVPAVVTALGVPIEVRLLPEPQPANFCGGVGRYDWSVSADKQTLSTDDVLTLTIRIRGNGDARRLSPPRLQLPASLECLEPEVRAQEEYETGDEFVHQHTLTYAILPKRPGTYLFTPETFFFHPDSGSYQPLRTEKPLELTVVPGATYSKTSPTPDSLSSTAFVDGDDEWDAQSHLPQPWLFVTAGITALLTLAWLTHALWRRPKARSLSSGASTEPPLGLPDRRSLEEQLHRLRACIPREPPEVFYRRLLKWTENAVAAALNTPPQLLCRDAALAQLAERGLPPAALEALKTVWEQCERAVYAHLELAGDMPACWEKAHLAWKGLKEAAFKKR